jgi:hypothetical protein
MKPRFKVVNGNLISKFWTHTEAANFAADLRKRGDEPTVFQLIRVNCGNMSGMVWEKV